VDGVGLSKSARCRAAVYFIFNCFSFLATFIYGITPPEKFSGKKWLELAQDIVNIVTSDVRYQRIRKAVDWKWNYIESSGQHFVIALLRFSDYATRKLVQFIKWTELAQDFVQ